MKSNWNWFSVQFVHISSQSICKRWATQMDAIKRDRVTLISLYHLVDYIFDPFYCWRNASENKLNLKWLYQLKTPLGFHSKCSPVYYSVILVRTTFQLNMYTFVVFVELEPNEEIFFKKSTKIPFIKWDFPRFQLKFSKNSFIGLNLKCRMFRNCNS